MNFKLRLMNKVTLTSLIVMVIAIVYKILDIVGIIPPIAQQELLDIAEMVIAVLVLLGIITDPTTAGIQDSKQVMNYEEPRKDS